MNLRYHTIASLMLFGAFSASCQLAVNVFPPKLGADKVIVPMTMKNGFAERVESARAVCFILDDQGKLVGQASRWIIGGTADKAGLAPGATNAFNFVVSAAKPFAASNLTAKVSFSRLILEGGKLADPQKAVTVSSAAPK